MTDPVLTRAGSQQSHVGRSEKTSDQSRSRAAPGCLAGHSLAPGRAVQGRKIAILDKKKLQNFVELLSWQLVRTILFMQQLRGVTALNIFLAFRMTRKCKYLNLNLARFNQLRLRVLPDYNIHLHPPPSEMHNIR